MKETFIITHTINKTAINYEFDDGMGEGINKEVIEGSGLLIARVCKIIDQNPELIRISDFCDEKGRVLIYKSIV